MHILLVFIFFFHAKAQHSLWPVKESVSDLRSHIVLFSVAIKDEAKTYQLERTVGEDYFLRLKIKGTENIRKVAAKEALRLDRDFASRFLRCQYEMTTKAGECKLALELFMKGEGQVICQKDDDKNQEFKIFLDQLAKYFSESK